jgi:hypothetical protein
MSDLVDAIVNHSMNRLIVGTAILAGIVYFGFLLLGLGALVRPIWRRLGERLSTDPPEFDPKSSSATSLTAVTSILGAILSAKLLPTPSPASPSATTTHLPSADTYVYLNLFFVAVLGLALVFYFSLGRRLWIYLIADWLIFWGAFGVVVGVDLALLEMMRFSAFSRGVFGGLVTLALAAVARSRIRSTLTLLRDLANVSAQQALTQAGRRWQVK